MKKLLLLIFFVCAAQAVTAGSGDTTFYTRPYYIGLTAGYSFYPKDLASTPPSSVHPGTAFGPTRVYWSASYGLMWAFPFARRMECEIGLEGNFVKGRMTEITDVHYLPSDPFRPAGYDFITRATSGNYLTTRLQFTREVYRRNDVGINVGLEAWTAVAAAKDVYNEIGFQLVGKMYLPVSHGNGAVQLNLFYGVAHSGSYAGVRVAFCLKGTRVYRHKPKSYYVRTYED